MFDTNVDLVRSLPQLGDLLLDLLVLLLGEVPLLQSSQAGASQALEASLPDVVVRRILPDWSSLDIGPGHHCVVDH